MSRSATRGRPYRTWLTTALPRRRVAHSGDHQLSASIRVHALHVDRDALFSYHAASEAFAAHDRALRRVHYKNTPNDLQLMSDARLISSLCCSTCGHQRHPAPRRRRRRAGNAQHALFSTALRRARSHVHGALSLPAPQLPHSPRPKQGSIILWHTQAPELLYHELCQ